MKRLNSRTVKLTDYEIKVSEEFDDLLDRGKSILNAVAIIRNIYGETLSEEFYTYLSE